MATTIRLTTFYLSFILYLLLTSTLHAAECIPDLGEGNICTAKDFTLTETILNNPVPTSCTEGEIVSPPLNVRVGMEPTAKERYDIGLFAGDNGESPIAGESCTFISLTPIENGGNFDGTSGSGPYRDLDSNQCGDTLKDDGVVYRDMLLSNVLCQDSDNDGKLDLAYVLTWQQQAGDCDDPTDPANFHPPTSSKCISGVNNFDIDVDPPTGPPSINVMKSASPHIVEAPGAEITYSLTITNDGPVAVTLTTLGDDKFGSINATGSCSLPQPLEPMESYQCSFTENITGTAGTTHTNTITAIAVDSNATQATDNDNATVYFVAPSETASIGDLVWNDLDGDGYHSSDEPGIAGVTVTLSQDNGSGYTDLETKVTTTDGHYEFTALPAGTFRITADTSTPPLSHMVHTGGALPHDVPLSDNEHYMLADFGFSQASITVTKAVAPDVVPANSPTPVDYTVTVQNDGAVEVVLTELYDAPFGDLSTKGCILPQTLAKGDSYTCTFQETISGNLNDTHTNTVFALGQDQNNNHVYAADSAQVSFIDSNKGIIGHLVWNDLNADGVYDLGEPFFDDVTMALSGTESTTTTTHYGGQYIFHGLAAGNYTVAVTDTNAVLNQHVLTTLKEPYDNITLNVGEINGLINFGYVKAQLAVTKTADKTIIFSPGEVVTFSITVSNPGSIALDVTVLNDNVFGDLNGTGSCSLPQALAAGADYTCTFTENIRGNAGDMHNNVVDVTAEDSAGNVFSASDNETIRIIGDIGGAIGHLVWLDNNGDGIKDSDEPGIDGITVDLLQNSSVIASTVTTHGGRYGFLATNGNYNVLVTDTSHLLDGLTLSGGSNPHTNIAINNSIYLSANFGYTTPIVPPVASLTLDKATNGEDADNSPGPTIPAGENIDWTYVAANTGSYFLTAVTVTDDQGVSVTCPKDSLEIGESMTCNGNGRAARGQYKNIGTVTATAPSQGVITASDPSHYFCKPFPWHLFIPRPDCSPVPDYCYMVADRDSFHSNNSPLFKYIFKTDTLELVNRLGVSDVETMTLSLDGKTLYAVDGAILGIIDPTPGASRSFTPINPNGIGSGYGVYGPVTFRDIDGLAFDPTTEILYGTERYREQTPDIMDLLIQIDPTTGQIIKDAFGTGIDYITIDTPAAGVQDVDDIDIDSNGRLYGISGGGGGDQGVIIDKQTGAVSRHAPLIDPAGKHIQDMEGLTLYNSRYFYGTTGIEFTDEGTDNTLYRIDKTSGETEAVTRLNKDFNGYTPEDFEAISCFPVCGNK